MPAVILYPNTQPDDPALQSVWQVQEAKNRFSELIEAALAQGPQVVTRHGKPVVQIVPITSTEPPKQRKAKSLGEHLLLLRDLPPGPELELPPRWNRSPERMVKFDE
jgi:antitoxin Phd